MILKWKSQIDYKIQFDMTYFSKSNIYDSGTSYNINSKEPQQLHKDSSKV